MNVLLVEDEEHKTKDLCDRLTRHGIKPDQLEIVTSVRDAVLTVNRRSFDLVVLDMALPTFSKAGSEDVGGGLAQSVGGVEVLRALKAAGQTSKIIVVTQYPEIIISGQRVKLSSIGKFVSSKYKQSVTGAVLYAYNTPEWGAHFDMLLRKMK